MNAFDPRTYIERIKTASIIDAIGRTYAHRAYLLDLVTPTPGRVLFGPAATIAFLPYRQDIYDAKIHQFGRLFYQAVGENPKGKVLVMASSGYADISMGGGTKFSRLQNHGMAGLLCDGRVRDFDELAEYDFACYCRGEATRWGGDTIMPYAANVPASIGGVAVFPGDYVFADSSGAAIIPAGDIQAILEEALRVEVEDARSIETIRHENPEDVLKGKSAEH